MVGLGGLFEPLVGHELDGAVGGQEEGGEQAFVGGGKCMRAR